MEAKITDVCGLSIRKSWLVAVCYWPKEQSEEIQLVFCFSEYLIELLFLSKQTEKKQVSGYSLPHRKVGITLKLWNYWHILNNSIWIDFLSCFVQNHYGGLDGGHYTAYCKNAARQRWFKFDDHEVSDISISSVKSSAAYILYYPSLGPRITDVAT